MPESCQCWTLERRQVKLWKKSKVTYLDSQSLGRVRVTRNCTPGDTGQTSQMPDENGWQWLWLVVLMRLNSSVQFQSQLSTEPHNYVATDRKGTMCANVYLLYNYTSSAR